MKDKKIYKVNGVSDVKTELIENLEKYQKLFEKFKNVLEKDDSLKGIFDNSISNIDDAISVVKNELNVHKINHLLKIIRKHRNL